MIQRCKFCKSERVLPGKREKVVEGICNKLDCLMAAYEYLDQNGLLDGIKSETPEEQAAMREYLRRKAEKGV